MMLEGKQLEVSVIFLDAKCGKKFSWKSITNSFLKKFRKFSDLD